MKENSNYMNELQSLDREKQELNRTEERIQENDRALEEMQTSLRVLIILHLSLYDFMDFSWIISWIAQRNRSGWFIEGCGRREGAFGRIGEAIRTC